MEAFKDLLHVHHQGVLCVCIASVITDHLEDKYPDMTLDGLSARLSDEVWNHYKRWCRQSRKSSASHRFNLARFGRERWVGYPELSNVYKAAVVKDMAAWARDYLWKNMGQDDQSRTRAYCMHSFCMFQYMVDEGGEFFTLRDARRTADYLRMFLLFYQKLAANNRAAGHHVNYKVTPKFHSSVHLAASVEESHRSPKLLDNLFSKFLVFDR